MDVTSRDNQPTLKPESGLVEIHLIILVGKLVIGFCVSKLDRNGCQ